MKKERRPKDFIDTTAYPGGPEAMRKFIKENLKYPKDALEKKIEGTVVVKFEINQKGEVTKAQVKKGLGAGCDEEAIRVVKLLKFRKSKNRGLKVVFHRTININFKLPKKLDKQPQQVIYNYVEGKTKQEKKEPVKAPSYTYTIRNSRS